MALLSPFFPDGGRIVAISGSYFGGNGAYHLPLPLNHSAKKEVATFSRYLMMNSAERGELITSKRTSFHRGAGYSLFFHLRARDGSENADKAASAPKSWRIAEDIALLAIGHRNLINIIQKNTRGLLIPFVRYGQCKS